MTAAATPSQTIGPFFRFGLAWLHGRELVAPGAPDAVVVAGRVLDGDGMAVPDAVIEIYQPDAGGGWPPSWRGFGRSLTDDEGRYRFVTVKPGRIDDRQAPHIDVSVFARGLLQRLVTRIYFPDEAAANAVDPLLCSIADPDRVTTLVASADDAGLSFDIVLQGQSETVFFAW
jgi:protocatechuate 3,4-dioxygenase alpha subunit